MTFDMQCLILIFILQAGFNLLAIFGYWDVVKEVERLRLEMNIIKNLIYKDICDD